MLAVTAILLLLAGITLSVLQQGGTAAAPAAIPATADVAAPGPPPSTFQTLLMASPTPTDIPVERISGPKMTWMVVTKSVETRASSPGFQFLTTAGRQDWVGGEPPRYFRWIVEQPILESSTQPERDAFNAFARAAVSRIEGENPLPEWHWPQNYLSIEASKIISTAEYIGVEWETIALYSGAYPNNGLAAAGFDRRLARGVTLKDLFKPGSGYLLLFAESCLSQLRVNNLLGESNLPIFTNPTDDDYQNWLLTPEGFTLVFRDNAISAHAVGPQRVTIPYEKLRPYMRPGSLIEDVANRNAGR